MRRFSAYLVIFIGVLLLLQGCIGRGRVIPKDTMAHIYADMFVADQWLKDHPADRKTADTTFFYEPVFEKYGYDFEDYDASVRYYTKYPEKFTKVMEKSADILDKEISRLKAIKEKQKLAREHNAAITGYTCRDFKDSTLWSLTMADSILSVIKENVERRDSVRTDTLETPGQLAGLEPLAEEREDM